MENKKGKLPKLQFATTDENRQSVTLNSNSRTALYGRSRFFSHNNHYEKDKENHTCGHAAIASMLDFFDRNPWRLQRKQRGAKLADDGRRHFPDLLVDQIYKSYPPTDWFFFKFCSRETILKALRMSGLKANDSYKGAFEGPEKYSAHLKQWIAKYKLPVIVLMDSHRMSPYVDGIEEGWNQYHWGIIFGYTNKYVLMGSWKQVFKIPWAGFLHSWACGALPWDHQYYAIYTYLPKR